MFKNTQIRYCQKVALSMAFLIAFQAAFPVAGFALTSGPTQPEYNSFEPVGTTQMVDLFSGDFTYNIPLFELPGPDGGYPFNLAYHSGITMDQEASWVGLGWSMNHGAITRTMRGFPDDFDGDEVTRRMDMKDNRTHTFTLKGHYEFWGFEPPVTNSDGSITEGTPGNATFNFALSVIDNSYKGLGISTDVGLNSKIFQAGNTTFSGSLGLGVNSMEGSSLNAGLSFGDSQGKLGQLNANASIGSRDGINNLSLGYSKQTYTKTRKSSSADRQGQISQFRTASSSYTFGVSSYSPEITMPYSSFNLTAGLEFGGFAGVAALGLGADYSFMRQELKGKSSDNFVTRKAPAFGYFNMKNRIIDNALMDFNREKEGPLNKDTPNLPNPVTTPDIYAVKGQGVGGSYQAFRSDIGILTDPIIESNGGGFTVGVEGNPGTGFDLGVDLGGNWSFSRNEQWVADNMDFSPLQYKNEIMGSDFEPFYFKAAGEMTAEPTNTYDEIGGSKAVKIKRNNMSVSPKLSTKKEGEDYDFIDIPNDGKRAERKPRANSIQHISNQELLRNDDTEILGEYQISYYTSTENYNLPPNTPLQRANRPAHHTAGITALQPGGTRYVYALPVVNYVHDELVFSIDGSSENCSNGDGIITITNSQNGSSSLGQIANGDALKPEVYKTGLNRSDDYYNHTSLPEYTHAYLLTSVLGADYVDKDNIPGPSDGDLGYWVKFNYVQTADSISPYKWRAPFQGANLLKGRKSINYDDKASFSYGEREQYYLATAETRTHLAKFYVITRTDGKGASNRFQNSNNIDEDSYQLNKIELFSKLELSNNGNNAVPMKTVHFTYNSTGLCSGIDNGNSGKLTLSEVYFTYENSNRGALSPYKFDYTGLNNVPGLNPNYSNYQYDRWGNHNPITACEAEDAPYTPQSESQATMDERAAAWHLTNIILPSGAEMIVDYEADDYGYVQDKVAMQMFKISQDAPNNNNVLPTGEVATDSDDLKVYFDLEQPVTSGANRCEIKSYVEDLHGIKFIDNDPNCAIDSDYPGQLYFKVFTDLLNTSANENSEFVEGYAFVEDYGVDANDGSVGWVKLKPTRLGTKNNKKNYHPFVAAAWQALKLEFSDKMHGENLNDNDGDFEAAISRFWSVSKEIVDVFKSFYSTCSDREYGGDYDANQSWIRLNTPDKKKYGGGNRVKQITLYDNADADNDSTYGQVFDYTTEDENGNTISSGVAANEPVIGYEECALRYAKQYTNGAFLKSDENLFFEYPINETYYPGASVGYSKVTVKSLATSAALGENPNDIPASLPSGFGTTGETINEFYTCKDFPVIVEETLNDDKVGSPRWIPIGIGDLRFDNYTASQGYAITLNDMHGKPYKVTHYGLDKNNVRIPEKINEVIYTYSEGDAIIESPDGNRVKKRTLDNDVKVLLSNNTDTNTGSADIEVQSLGVDYEFFTDVRASKVDAGQFYVGLNVDFVPPFIFGLSGFPRLSINDSRTRTAVTNKIIRKSGILKRIDAYDGQSHITTTNEVFDPMTGQPLLTTVNNNYDDLVYSLDIPARYSYEGMGAAYKNWDVKFNGMISEQECCSPYQMVQILNPSQNIYDELQVGDEFAVYEPNSIILLGVEYPLPPTPSSLAVLMKKGEMNTLYFDIMNPDNLDFDNSTFHLLRSGKRNHLSVSSGQIVTLNNDPTLNRTSNSEVVDVSIPETTGSNNVTVDYSTINNVVNTNAITFCDTWGIIDTCDLAMITSDSCSTTQGGGDMCYNISFWVSVYATSNCNDPNNICCACQDLEYTISFDLYDPLSMMDVSHTLTGVLPSIATNSSCGQGLNYPVNVNQNINDPNNILPADIEPSNIVVTLNSSPSGNTYCGSSYIYNPHNIQTIMQSCGGGTPMTMDDDHVTNAPNPYLEGEKGIWRPQKTYTYIENRNYGNPVNQEYEFDLQTNGTFDNLPLFDWQNPFFTETNAAEKWVLTNESTQYNNRGEATESKNVLCQYSSAIYGYNDNVPIAVGANLRQLEMGYEGFENLPIAPFQPELYNEGNLDFALKGSDFSQSVNNTISETYNLIGGFQQGGTVIWIDKPYTGQNNLPDEVKIQLKNVIGEEHTVFARMSAIGEVTSATLGIDFHCNISMTSLTLDEVVDCELTDMEIYTGKVILRNCDTFTGAEVNFLPAPVSTTIAHSGKQSLAIPNTRNFVQKTLELHEGKDYVISGWVHRPNFEGHTFNDNTISMTIDMTGQPLVEFFPEGRIIEGWQKIEGTFNYQDTDGEFTLGFKNITGALTYFDDVRIFPKHSNIQTYVYDPLDYELRATLDNNNYATFYRYDEEGNLFLLKKETERGIKTIQETRGYVSENN